MPDSAGGLISRREMKTEGEDGVGNMTTVR